MGGIGALYSIGRSALLAYQQALAVTGHNISNVNTKGYSRQVVTLAAGSPQDEGVFVTGTGVEVASIQRQYDEFVEGQLTASHGRLGRYQASRNILNSTQGFFQDASSNGVSAALSEFFNAFEDVGNNPGDATSRSVLIARAGTLATRLNRTAGNLQVQRRSLDGQITQTVDEVNQLARQIAELNTKIGQTEIGGQTAGDLRDQRAHLVNDLAERIDITTLEDGSGQLTVFVGRGQSLVAQRTAHQLQTVPDPSNSGFAAIEYVGDGATAVTISSVIGDGRLKGLLDARDTTIPGLLSELDALTATLVTQVNQIHEGGFDLDGLAGQAFFTAAGVTAGTVSVAVSDGRKIAASSTAAGVPGNNANALALAALQSQAQANLGNVTLGDYYAQTASGIGTAAQNADRELQAQDIIHGQLEAHRAEISGVSLDEEMVAMLQYQRAFEAASRVIVATDEMFQTLISLKR